MGSGPRSPLSRLIALIGLFFTGRIPRQQPGSMPRGAEGPPGVAP